MAYITHYTFYILFNDLTSFISNAYILYFSLHLSLDSCFDNHLMKICLQLTFLAAFSSIPSWNRLSLFLARGRVESWHHDLFWHEN